MRPSIILSLLSEKGKDAVKDTMEALWNGQPCDKPNNAQIRDWSHDSGAYEKATTLLEGYKEAAIRSLQEVEIPNLKGLREFEQKNIDPSIRAEAAKAAEHLVAMPQKA